MRNINLFFGIFSGSIGINLWIHGRTFSQCPCTVINYKIATIGKHILNKLQCAHVILKQMLTLVKNSSKYLCRNAKFS